MSTRSLTTPPHLVATLDVVRAAITKVGQQRVAVVSVARGRICLQPAELSDGESIAKALGCDNPIDHRMFVPGHTIWTGDMDGLEVQVRATLRERSAIR